MLRVILIVAIGFVSGGSFHGSVVDAARERVARDAVREVVREALPNTNSNRVSRCFVDNARKRDLEKMEEVATGRGSAADALATIKNVLGDDDTVRCLRRRDAYTDELAAFLNS